MGSRSYFRPRPDVPQYCGDDCPIEKECRFSIFRLFPGLKEGKANAWNSHARCVYNSGSDLVDHQSSILEYANGVTVAFSLMPLGPRDDRLFHFCGSEATLTGSSAQNEFRLCPYRGSRQVIPGLDTGSETHGGGDRRIAEAFLNWLDDPANRPKALVKQGWEAMIIGWTIEQARAQRKVIEVNLDPPA